jgi:hypothetical protein
MDTANGGITCPRCGTVQPHGDECGRCGVVFAKLTAAARPVAAAAPRLAPRSMPATPPAAARPAPWLAIAGLSALAAVALFLAWPRRSAAPDPAAEPAATATVATATPPAEPSPSAGPAPGLALPAALPGAPLGWYEGASGYQAALAEARADRHPVAVYFRTDWCPVCKEFDRALLSTPEVRRRAMSGSGARPTAALPTKLCYPSRVSLPSSDTSTLFGGDRTHASRSNLPGSGQSVRICCLCRRQAG